MKVVKLGCLGVSLLCILIGLVGVLLRPSSPSAPVAVAKSRAASQPVLNPEPVEHVESQADRLKKLFPDDGKQPERKAFLQKMLNEGVFQKIETPGSLPHVWVTPKFLLGNFDAKQSIMGVAVAYYVREDPKYSMVVIYDSITGKKIGTMGFDGQLSLN